MFDFRGFAGIMVWKSCGRLFLYESPECEVITRGLFVLGGYEVDAYNAILSELWFLQAA